MAINATGRRLDVINATVHSTSGSFAINADSVALGSGRSLTGTGTLTIEPVTASTTIGIGGGAGTLNIDNTELGLLADGN